MQHLVRSILFLQYFLSFGIHFQVFIYKYKRLFVFPYDSALLLITSFFLFQITYLKLCALLKIYKTFSCDIYLCIHHAFFSMLWNGKIVDIKKSCGICSLTFLVDDFSGLSFYPSIFSIKHSRSAEIINGPLSDFWYWLNSNILVSSEGIKCYKNLYFHILFYEILICFLLQKNDGNWDKKHHHGVLGIMALNNDDSFLLKDNTILFYVEPLK